MRVILLFLVSCNFVLGANILGLWYHAGKSHHILGEVLLKELATRGHNITMVSPFPLREPFPNYTDIYLTGIKEDQKAREKMFLEMNDGDFMKQVKLTIGLTRAQVELTMAHPEIRKLKDSGVKFDVIIMDWFMNKALLYFGKLFQAPVIAIASHGTTIMSNYITGNPTPPSYLPMAMVDLPNNMTFFQRLTNSIIYLIANVMTDQSNGYNQNLIKKYFNDTITEDEVRDILALVLTNGHFSYEHPRPFVPNVIPVGGFHVTKPKKMPKHFEDFINEADDGFIFFSLGSNMKSVLLPDSIRKEILKVFSKLPQKVIWKWEDENMTDIPENVLISKWCPQNDILAHPKLKLFISHGGLLSTIESLHYGVPVLGIPIFGDQVSNVKVAVHNGYAVELRLKDVNEITLSAAIHEILSNPTYRQTAKKRSQLLREQPLSPMDTAVFWVEHVIRHKGGKHLQNYGSRLPWYQYHLIDVISLLVFVVLLFIISSFIIIRMCIRMFSNLFFKSRKGEKLKKN